MRVDARYLVKWPAELQVGESVLSGETQDMNERSARIRLLDGVIRDNHLDKPALLLLNHDTLGDLEIVCSIRRIWGNDVGVSFEGECARTRQGERREFDQLIPLSAPMLDS